jgi:hypothetical protein
MLTSLVSIWQLSLLLRLEIAHHHRFVLASALEMTWIGIIVAVMTYGRGLAFGAFG